MFLGDFEDGGVTAIHGLGDGVDEVGALIRAGDVKGKVQQVLDLAGLGAAIEAFRVARDADVQRGMDVNPDELLREDAQDDVALGVLGGHGGNDDVHPLLRREPGDFGDAPVVLNAGLGGELEVGAKAGAHVIAIQIENRDAAVDHAVAEAPSQRGFTGAGAAEEPEDFGHILKS